MAKVKSEAGNRKDDPHAVGAEAKSPAVNKIYNDKTVWIILSSIVAGVILLSVIASIVFVCTGNFGREIRDFSRKIPVVWNGDGRLEASKRETAKEGVRGLSGKVQDVNEKLITIKPREGAEKTFSITADTTVRVLKSETASKTGETNVSRSSRISIVDGKISDIREGDNITVRTTEKNESVAKIITVMNTTNK